MFKDKLKNINWGQVIVIVIIFIIALIIDSQIGTESESQLKELKQSYVVMKEQNETLETKLQDLTNEQIEFEIEQEEKNKAYEVMFENQNEVNKSTSEVIKILIGF